MRSLAQARLKRVRAVELLADGHTFDEIAQRVGYTHRASAYRAVAKALSEREVESIETFRATQLCLLDALENAVWDRAAAGDLVAGLAELRIIEQRCRILGLYGPGRPAAPEPQFASMVVDGVGEGNTGEATLADVQRIAARQRGLPTR